VCVALPTDADRRQAHPARKTNGQTGAGHAQSEFDGSGASQRRGST
jgi:hypothetical protein